jgi:hypothetical protein
MGAFVVTWMSDYRDVFAQRFDRDGNRAGAEFWVNSLTTGTNQYPSVASDAEGNFVIVWDRTNQFGNDAEILGQRFDPAGSKIGTEFQVNSVSAGVQRYASVALDPAGGAIVTWESYTQPGSNVEIFAQRFDKAGNRIGTEFRVNATTFNTQDFTTVAVDADGDAFVVWESYGQDGNAEGVYGRRIASPTPDVVAPGVRGFVVNDGTGQRSRVTSVTVEFTERVAITPGTFRLVRTGPGGVLSPVTLVVDTSSSTANRTVARLSFAGPQTQFGSLIDGLYTLSVEGGKFEDFSGNAGQGSVYLFHRLFGDSNGDRTVNASDILAFRLAFLSNGPSFDYDNNGVVDAADFLQFRLRFLLTV